jgi:hypothetical protein
MRVIDIILESNGIRAGTPGEPYTDANGVEYQFQAWNWQFPAATDKYATPEDMQADIGALTGGDPNKILWVNQPTNKLKSFGFATFAVPTPPGQPKQEIWVGGYYQSKKANNTITDTQIKNVSGLTAGSADKPASSAIKAGARLKPFDVGIADGGKKSVNTIVKAVSTHVDGQMLSASLVATVKGEPVLFVNAAKLVPALQDDFGEVLSPIAMIAGHPQLTGQLDKAVLDVFKGQDLTGATISYPVSQINGLVDSYIHKGGMELAVSSKGKKGANGSLNNIHKAKEQAKATTTGQAYIAKFPLAVEILDICKLHQRDAPLELGIKFGLINASEKSAIESLMADPRDPSQQLSGNPKNPGQIVKPAMPQDLAKVPPVLHRIFNMGGYKAGSFVGFICMARVASLVAQHVNADPTIDFGEAIRSFLNSSAMVQVKCHIKATGSGDAALESVNVVYPPNFTQKARMESNWYSGKQIKGGFSFSLPTS